MLAATGARELRRGPGGMKWLELALRWGGRGLACVLLVMWGAFFVEHVREWYVQPSNGFPPRWVLAVMVSHLVMLVGLAVSLRWGRVGAAVTLVGTAAFIGITAATAKPAVILLVNVAPAACFWAAWLVRRRAGSS